MPFHMPGLGRKIKTKPMTWDQYNDQKFSEELAEQKRTIEESFRKYNDLLAKEKEKRLEQEKKDFEDRHGFLLESGAKRIKLCEQLFTLEKISREDYVVRTIKKTEENLFQDYNKYEEYCRRIRPAGYGNPYGRRSGYVSAPPVTATTTTGFGYYEAPTLTIDNTSLSYNMSVTPVTATKTKAWYNE